MKGAVLSIRGNRKMDTIRLPSCHSMVRLTLRGAGAGTPLPSSSFKSQMLYSSARVNKVLSSTKYTVVGNWHRSISTSITMRLFMLYLFELDVHYPLIKMKENQC